MQLAKWLGAWVGPCTSAAATIGVFHLFFVYDIGFGWLRGPLLLVLGGATLLPAWFGEASGSRFLPKRVAASLLLILVAIPTGYAITWANRDFRSEMGEIRLRAVPLLLQGVNPLRHTDCDLFPTLLAFSGVVALVRNRPALAGALFGFSMGAKLLPAVLYLPLLLRMPRRAIGVFCLVVGICFAPLAIADLPGTYQQLIGFNLMRGTSSTVLPYFLPEWLTLLLRVLALLATVLVAWRYVWSGPQTTVGILKYLLCAHVAFLFTSKLLHNNYLVWVFPIVAALMSLLLSATRISDELSCHHREGASVPAGRLS